MLSEFNVVWVNKTSPDILIFKAQKDIFEFSCYQNFMWNGLILIFKAQKNIFEFSCYKNFMWYGLIKPVLTYSFLKLRKIFLSFHVIRILCGMG